MAIKKIIFFNKPGEGFNAATASGGWNWTPGVLNDGAYFVTDENNSKGAMGGYEQGTSWGPAKKSDMSKVLKYFGDDADKYEVEGKKLSAYTSPRELQQALNKAGYELDEDDYAGSETMNTLLNYLRGDDTGHGEYLTPRSSKKLSKRISKKTTSKPASSVDIQFTKPVDVKLEPESTEDDALAQDILEYMQKNRPKRKQGGTLKRTIAHKFQTGGWIDLKKGIWNYEDPSMQKKIMQGYQGKGWSEDAKTYLAAHPELQKYLSNAYKKSKKTYKTYYTPDSKKHVTQIGQWAEVSQNAGTQGNFENLMNQAGFTYDPESGTYQGKAGDFYFINDAGQIVYTKANGNSQSYSSFGYNPQSGKLYGIMGSKPDTKNNSKTTQTQEPKKIYHLKGR